MKYANIGPHQRLMLKTILGHIEFFYSTNRAARSGSCEKYLVPEQNESAGKRKSAKTKKLSSALTETAHSFR